MCIHVYHELSFALLSRYYFYVNKLDLIHWDIVVPLSHRFRANVTGRNSRKKRLPCSKHSWLPFSILWNYPPATPPQKREHQHGDRPYQTRKHYFSLHKQAFKDALCVCYGWEPNRLPSHCSCRGQFTMPSAVQWEASPQFVTIRSKIWQLNCFPRSAQMLRWNYLSNHWPQIYSHTGQPMWKSTSWDSMSRFKASGGAIGNAHIFMGGCSTRRRQPIAPKASQWATNAMRKKREGPTRRELSKWSTNLSHQFSCPP